MSSPTVSLRPIKDLLSERFFIPSYQRGYRWTSIQVTDLLNDLWEFQKQPELKPSDFYCLQPLVIKKRGDGSLEVVDGQQRLTTIFLILTFLKPLAEMLGRTPFTLSFETRPETSETFLKNIDLTRSDENIDFHHISNALEAIGKWFENRDTGHRVNILQTLTNDNEAGKNVKVIWYELPKSEDAIEAFTRLNIGKIPLTNAELIRALFLRSDNFGSETRNLQQLRIAQEWDLIEKTLQTSEFWYFLHSGHHAPASRIEFLFELIVAESSSDEPISDDPYRSFHFYNVLLKQPGISPEKTWLELKQFFMTIEEWFRDRSLYHLVGFLIHQGVSVAKLREAARNLPKSAFDSFLRKQIFEDLFGSAGELAEGESLDSLLSQRIAELEYGRSNEVLRSVLLLFNIATLLENERSNLRFPFDSFKKELWDIEHVRSVDSAKPDRPDAQKRWLQNVRDCFSEIQGDESWLPKIDEVLSSVPFNNVSFDELYEQLLNKAGEAEGSDADHRIENLTLLDQSTNRSYKNAIFPVKRHQILSLDRSGTFVPLCTRNIFLKCYSKKLDDMLQWNEGDKQDYRSQIVSTLAYFFKDSRTLPQQS